MLVYRILNKINNKSYIGQTTGTFSYRYANGKWWERTRNPLLKNAIAKYGKEAFEVQILEDHISSRKSLNEREIFYAEYYNSYEPNGYNIRGCGDSLEVSDATKSKISIGRSTQNWQFRCIDTWEIVTTNNLKKFCRDHNLDYQAMGHMISPKTDALSSQGYCKLNVTKDQLKTAYIKKYHEPIWVIDRDGNEHCITHPRRFAEQMNVQYVCLYNLLKGKAYACGGFRLKNPIVPVKPAKHEISVIDPQGRLVKGYCAAVFCREHNLPYQAFTCMLRGERKQCQGWSVAKPSTEENVL